MVMDLQDLEVQREILDFLDIPACRARTACRDLRDTRDGKGTVAEGETLGCRERREGQEGLAIQDTEAPEVLLEAWE